MEPFTGLHFNLFHKDFDKMHLLRRGAFKSSFMPRIDAKPSKLLYYETDCKKVSASW